MSRSQIKDANATPPVKGILRHVKWEHLVAGVSGGAASTLLLHPLDLVKIRFQGKLLLNSYVNLWFLVKFTVSRWPIWKTLWVCRTRKHFIVYIRLFETSHQDQLITLTYDIERNYCIAYFIIWIYRYHVSFVLIPQWMKEQRRWDM